MTARRGRGPRASNDLAGRSLRQRRRRLDQERDREEEERKDETERETEEGREMQTACSLKETQTEDGSNLVY